jgi:hypothetical protein
MHRLLYRTLALVLAFGLTTALTARADEPPAPKDDALDRLLEKLEKPSPPPGDKPATEPAKEKEKEKEKETAGKASSDAKPEGDKKPGGSVSAKDQALDNLLEKLAETPDRPAAPDERRRPGPMPGPEQKEPAPAKPGERGGQELTGKAKELDEHLEEITGRKRKKKNQDEEASGPLAKVVKEMREVEQRLGQPDTGEETRKKQAEIVKNLEHLIDQLRNSSSQSRGQRMRMVMQPGQKPGAQQGQQPGANATGASATKPAKPDGKHAVAGGKDVWGHLPDELRQEMDNVAREGMLPSKDDLIRRYYLSVSKKSLTREE